ncbi:MAG: hypothetical protein DWQ07_21075 [Chloroflexi bacterium]|nr:MAG: hypothetical protein DWQ07_21075 [Chloroflexota bacterium]MBL1194576.1 hypothetical protein [Chloroflexota bacterium]NOH11865.1 hypothetical protein [Chloroflexota bacterium]
MPAHKYARIERERRYLVKQLPEDLDQHGEFTRIIDNYVNATRLRLRRIETSDGEVIQYKLGQKYLTDDDDLENTVMTNLYLDAKEYGLLSELPAAGLVKRRYTYMYAGQRFSLDVFEEQLDGLVLCEIELPEDEVADIDLPPFVGRDVTQDARFTGGELVEMSFDNVQELTRMV